MRPLTTGRIITAALVVFVCSHATEAAQGPALSAPLRFPAAVSEDSGSWRRDPFIGSLNKGGGTPAVKGVPQKTGTALPKQEPELEQNIQLQGIMQVDSRFHALINGRCVKAGDTISGVTVRQISRYQVELFNKNKDKIIYDIYQGRIDRGKQ